METEMEKLLITIKENMSSDALSKFTAQNEADLLRWEKEIKTVKIKKFSRDQNDFQLNRVYKWRSNTLGRRSRSRSFSRTRGTSADSGCTFPGPSETDESDAEIGHSSGIVTRFKSRQQPSNVNKRRTPQVINLSQHLLSTSQIDVLSRGLSVSPSNAFHCFTAVKDLYIFARKVILTKLHNRRTQHFSGPLDLREQQAIQDLEELLDEAAPSTLDPLIFFCWHSSGTTLLTLNIDMDFCHILIIFLLVPRLGHLKQYCILYVILMFFHQCHCVYIHIFMIMELLYNDYFPLVPRLGDLNLH
ncbi:uncharacterized protein ACNLHF_012155 [Anomaloglossus baeobatrachus]|uniref:uncharacterized protein LOC142296191 n=1 Tax=Anomaloglossus baeobatrachus TaxID=238106 RepID=UPI003F4F6675